MKKTATLIAALLIAGATTAADIIHPLDFTGSEEEKQALIKFIQESVREKWTKLGLGDAANLRLMERRELDEFKKLTQVSDHALLDQMIDKWCNGLGICDYYSLRLQYEKQQAAEGKTLTW